ncbi:MAG: YdiU family protein [Bdellovibrionales bacterium]|nr:YdiU family protein [Bdellovibrionales bacterium]
MRPLKFDNRFLNTFPDIATRVHATHVKNPEMLIWSEEAAALIGLDKPKDPHGIEAQIFAGNQLVDGMQPYATRYGGHQFGTWAGQLGDGRALILGESINGRHERLEVQLKGAGQTPYSRRGDGRAVLRSSLREFLCSEAMFHLGVPTTRALCCVLTGDKVERDMFYDGHPRLEPGAITTRVATTFLRFGHFQVLAADRNVEQLKQLVTYTINTYYPELMGDRVKWFKELCRRTAALVVEWMRVGFVHGVMNTDNLSVLGLTIDYGPYGLMDIYDPDWTPNTTDEQNRRYRFGQQAAVALWNLQRMADALALLTVDQGENHTQWLREGLEYYADVYNAGYVEMMARKIGLPTASVDLLTKLDNGMRAAEIDMTMFFRQMAEVRESEPTMTTKQALGVLALAFYKWPQPANNTDPLELWLKDYLEECKRDTRPVTEIVKDMNAVNPYFILRNYLVQEALDGLEKGDRKRLDQIWRALRTPYEINSDTRALYKKMPDWARTRAGCSALSCSS